MTPISDSDSGLVARLRRCASLVRRGLIWLVLLSMLVVTPPGRADAQTDVELIAMALDPLDDGRRAEATVAIESPDGGRRILRTGTNGWICRLVVSPALFSQCYEGEVREVFMSVRRHGNRTVTGLRASELLLTHDGNSCNILSLTPGPERMRVALVVDNDSWPRPSLSALGEAVHRFLDALPEQHDVGLVAVSSPRTRIFGASRNELRHRARTLIPTGRSEGLLEGARETWQRHFDPTHRVWPVFVIVGHNDGFATQVRQSAAHRHS